MTKIKYKYLTCFTYEKSEQLKESGFSFLYEKNGVYYFEDKGNLIESFSNNDVLKETKKSMTINF